MRLYKRDIQIPTILSPDELGTNGLFRLLSLIVCLQLKDVPVDEFLSIWPEGEFQRKRFLSRDLGCQAACRIERTSRVYI